MEKVKKYFIIIANVEGVFAYNENNLTLYKKFIPSFENKIIGFDETIVIEKSNKVILISPCFYKQYLFFWDFKKWLHDKQNDFRFRN